MRYRTRPHTRLRVDGALLVLVDFRPAGCGPRSTGEFLLDMLAFRRATNGFLFANRPVRGQSISQDVDILCTAKIGSANHLHAKILPFIHNNFWTHSEVMLGPQARLRSQEDSFFFLKR